MRYSTYFPVGLLFSTIFFLWGQVGAEPIEMPVHQRGPLAVGSTNFEVAETYSGLSASTMQTYLQGVSTGRYVTDILKYPQSVESVMVPVPANPTIYGQEAGGVLPVSYYVMYPTRTDNPRANYLFPYANAYDPTFTHMEEPEGSPIFEYPNAKYPLVIVTHGYPSHVLYDVTHCRLLASNGYIVAAVFHADDRWGGTYNSMRKLAKRPLMVKAVIDDLLASPRFSSHIDADRIGIVGGSYGGFTVLASMGGKIGNNSQTVWDPRIKAGVGIIPWLGSSTTAGIFGSNNSALERVTHPFINLFGSLDTTAPSSVSLPALAYIPGNTYAVEMTGQGHLLNGAIWQDTQTWEFIFFDAYLKDDPHALQLLNTAASVEGAGQDHQLFQYQKLSRQTPVSFMEAYARDAGYIAAYTLLTSDEQGLHASIRFPFNTLSQSLHYELEVSDDLYLWTPVSTVMLDASPDAGKLPDGYTWKILSDPFPLDSVGHRRFLRVVARRL